MHLASKCVFVAKTVSFSEYLLPQIKCAPRDSSILTLIHIAAISIIDQREGGPVRVFAAPLESNIKLPWPNWPTASKGTNSVKMLILR